MAPTPAALQASDVRDGHARGEVGVLREALEVAAAERRAVDVDRGTQQHLRALGLRLLCQRLADAFDKRSVPGGGQRDPGREAGGLDAGGRAALAARAVRPVGHLERGDA